MQQVDACSGADSYGTWGAYAVSLCSSDLSTNFLHNRSTLTCMVESFERQYKSLAGKALGSVTYVLILCCFFCILYFYPVIVQGMSVIQMKKNFLLK